MAVDEVSIILERKADLGRRAGRKGRKSIYCHLQIMLNKYMLLRIAGGEVLAEVG